MKKYVILLILVLQLFSCSDGEKIELQNKNTSLKNKVEDLNSRFEELQEDYTAIANQLEIVKEELEISQLGLKYCEDEKNIYYNYIYKDGACISKYHFRGTYLTQGGNLSICGAENIIAYYEDLVEQLADIIDK